MSSHHIRRFKPRFGLLSHCAVHTALEVWTFSLHSCTSSTSVISDTLRWPHCKERMWGVREKPLCKQSSGCCECDVGSQRAQSAGQTCVRDDGGISAQRGKELAAAGVQALGQCVCSCMLLLTQSLTVHPLTTPRSWRCVQVRRWLDTTNIPVPWVDQGCVHAAGLWTEFQTAFHIWFIWLVWSTSNKRQHTSSNPTSLSTF